VATNEFKLLNSHHVHDQQGITTLHTCAAQAKADVHVSYERSARHPNNGLQLKTISVHTHHQQVRSRTG
jgi:hypothetical protein